MSSTIHTFSSVFRFHMPNMEFLWKLLLEYFWRALRTPWIRTEDASLVSVNRIYFRAALQLCVLFYSESRAHPLGTVKYAPAHFSWAHVCISARKSPLSSLRIYIAKAAISQVPCKVIMVDTTSGWCTSWSTLRRSNCCYTCMLFF